MDENKSGTSLRTCPFCMEQIHAEAKKCKHCGEVLDLALREIEQLKRNQLQQSPVVISNNNNNNNNNNDGGSPHINSGTAPASPVAVHHKNRLKYCLFALFFGIFGVHNFYAGYYGRGIAQLLLTIAFCAVGEPGAVGAIFIWAIIEMIVINRDADGVLFI